MCHIWGDPTHDPSVKAHILTTEDRKKGGKNKTYPFYLPVKTVGHLNEKLYLKNSSNVSRKSNKELQSGQNIRLVFHKQAVQKMVEIGQKILTRKALEEFSSFNKMFIKTSADSEII